MTTCFATFDQNKRNYKAGESVRGQFVLNTTTDKPVHAVYIQLRGEGIVFVNEYRNVPMKSGIEKIVDTRVNIIEATSLAAGTYTIPFNFVIPDNAPTSCFFDLGIVKYSVVLVIDRPWKFDKEFEELINVRGCYDLSKYPELLVPIENEVIKSFCCWPCASAPIILSLRMPISGYVPGETINCIISIDNQAVGNDLVNVQLSLIQIVKFASILSDARTVIRTRKAVICSNLVADRINRLSKKFINGTLVVPDTVHSSRERHVIRIQYLVLLSMAFGYFHPNCVIEVPIVIGTEPLIPNLNDNLASATEITQWIPQTPDTPAGATAPSAPCFDDSEPNTTEKK
ncbi:arrestin domain-containing protein 3-like [Drosophila albomicans]|uniref:Arrestin domain-containing protein 3-like n=1 Tax=Drosophila albomicans TaxID=7291 RepID=A0A6P8XE85_DROAB|nr:arrestin domain-containing protein 3-like [Drosophila albomicans]